MVNTASKEKSSVLSTEGAVGAMSPTPRKTLYCFQEEFGFGFLEGCGHDLVQKGENWVGKFQVDISSNE